MSQKNVHKLRMFPSNFLTIKAFLSKQKTMSFNKLDFILDHLFLHLNSILIGKPEGRAGKTIFWI